MQEHIFLRNTFNFDPSDSPNFYSDLNSVKKEVCKFVCNMTKTKENTQTCSFSKWTAQF